MQLVDVFDKHASEAYTKAIDYEGRLPAGIVPLSVATSAIDLLDGSNASSILGATSVSGTSSLFIVQAGTDGHDYLITVTTTLSSSAGTFVDQVKMQVRSRKA